MFFDLEMPAALQRSVATFRRSGSSGLVWDDILFFSNDKDQKGKEESKGEEENEDEIRELRPSQSMELVRNDVMVRPQPNGIGQATGVSPGLPPSPSKSFGRKVFRAIRKSVSAKEPKVSSF